MTARNPKSTPFGNLFLIPVSLGDTPWQSYLPPSVQQQATQLHYFIVETAKTARSQLKRMAHPIPLSTLNLSEIPQELDANLAPLLQPALEGHHIGLMSDAGCPAVADPGSKIVQLAHQLKIPVIPLVGPSSILLALMASGLNGQQFSFHGYLPVEEKPCIHKLNQLESASKNNGSSHIFIETPYRNQRLFELLLQQLKPNTQLCIALELNTQNQFVYCTQVKNWPNTLTPSLHKHPCIFLFQASR